MAARRSLDKDLLDALEACAKRLGPDVQEAGVRVGVLVATLDIDIPVTLGERRRINRVVRQVIAETARGDALTLAVWADKEEAYFDVRLGAAEDRTVDHPTIQSVCIPRRKAKSKRARKPEPGADAR